MAKKLYPITNKLNENSSRHCSCLSIEENVIKNNSALNIKFPDENSRNGTLTFVKSEGRTFAITCWHVIEYFRKLKKDSSHEESHHLYTMTPSPRIITDKFIRPYSENEYHKLDIGIAQIDSAFIDIIGKEAIDIDRQITPENIDFGYAVGFPEKLKYVKEKKTNGDIKISLPTISILAEIEEKPNSKFILFSVFDTPQGYDSYSGMSGGPIFWSNETDYGIYGIIYEANPSNFAGEKMAIMLAGELSTPNVIRHWISQIK